MGRSVVFLFFGCHRSDSRYSAYNISIQVVLIAFNNAPKNIYFLINNLLIYQKIVLILLCPDEKSTIYRVIVNYYAGTKGLKT